MSRSIRGCFAHRTDRAAGRWDSRRDATIPRRRHSWITPLPGVIESGSERARSAFRGRAGVSTAAPGILPGASGTGGTSVSISRAPTFGVPGRIPGTAGETPALPRNALSAFAGPIFNHTRLNDRFRWLPCCLHGPREPQVSLAPSGRLRRALQILRCEGDRWHPPRRFPHSR